MVLERNKIHVWTVTGAGSGARNDMKDQADRWAVAAATATR